MVTKKVVYGSFGDGPLKGIRNGDRFYKMEVNPKVNMGTYHVIDGHRITLRYHGQQQTCACCFQTAQVCPGKGMARKCDAAGGPKVELTSYIFDLWQKIGYSPGDVELDEDINQVDTDSTAFTPYKANHEDSDKYEGVSIKTFPKDTDHGDIVGFLIYSGLAESQKENIHIKDNGHVEVRNLDGTESKMLIENIHNKINFDRKLYCNGIIPLTPAKTESQSEAKTSPIVASPVATTSTPPPALPNPISPLSQASSSPTSIVNIGPLSKIPEIPEINLQLSNTDVVRRHSLSLRTPPHGSLADDILRTSNVQLKKVKDLMLDVKETLSDFGSSYESAASSPSSSSSSSDPEEEPPVEKKKPGKKRKSSLSPPKEYFLKKPNTANSPQ